MSASIAEESRKLLTQAQEHMRYRAATCSKKSGADCVAQKLKNLATWRKKGQPYSMRGIWIVKGDLVYDYGSTSETKKATFDMNKVIVDSNELLVCK